MPDYPGNPHWQMTPAYDAGTKRLIVFGGTVPDVGHTTETWVLKDANGLGNPQWVKLAPGGVEPHPRYSNSVGYDPVTNRLILFGGDNAPGSHSNPSGMDNDLWVLTNANGLGGASINYGLFGGFAGIFYDAYVATRPPAAGEQERLPLYQLYHVLNHANLFGGGYVAQARALIGSL